MTREEIAARIKQFLIERHPRSDKTFTDTTDIIEDWLPDSLALVEVVLFLEKTFGVQLASTDINHDAFKDVGTLAGLVEARRPKR